MCDVQHFKVGVSNTCFLLKTDSRLKHLQTHTEGMLPVQHGNKSFHPSHGIAHEEMSTPVKLMQLSQLSTQQ